MRQRMPQTVGTRTLRVRAWWLTVQACTLRACAYGSTSTTGDRKGSADSPHAVSFTSEAAQNRAGLDNIATYF